MKGTFESRHPEWDLMYISGLTAREIADVCHANIATVHFHLRVHGEQKAHADALQARWERKPPESWRKRLNEVLEFKQSNGRLPLANCGKYEKGLSTWLSKQRRELSSGLLTPGKIKMLNSLTGWNISPQRKAQDERWEENFSSFIKFTNENNFLPRYHNYDSEYERKIGVWLHVQYQNRREGKLRIERLEKLNLAYPNWHSSW